MSLLTIAVFREAIKLATLPLNGMPIPPTRIAANVKTLRWLLHWIVQQSDFRTELTSFGTPFFIPNIDSVPFAREDSLGDGVIAVMNDNFKNEDGALCNMIRVELPEIDAYEIGDPELAAGDPDEDVPVREEPGGRKAGRKGRARGKRATSGEYLQ